GKHEPVVDGQVAGVSVVPVTLPAPVRDEEHVIELELEAPVQRDEDRVLADVRVVFRGDIIGVDESKKPGTIEDATKTLEPPVTRRAISAILRKHVGRVPSVAEAEEPAERHRRPASH